MLNLHIVLESRVNRGARQAFCPVWNNFPSNIYCQGYIVEFGKLILQVCKDYITFPKDCHVLSEYSTQMKGLAFVNHDFPLISISSPRFYVWTMFCSYCFSPFRLLYQNTTDSVAYKLKFISCSYGGWEVQDLDAGRFGVW